MLKHLTPSDVTSYLTALTLIAGMICSAARWLEKRHRKEMAEAEERQKQRSEELRIMIREESGKILAEFKPDSGHSWFDRFESRMTEIFGRLDNLERRRRTVYPDAKRERLPAGKATRKVAR